MLQQNGSVEIKEGCCRKIIRLFAEKKMEAAAQATAGGSKSGATAGGPGGKSKTKGG